MEVSFPVELEPLLNASTIDLREQGLCIQSYIRYYLEPLGPYDRA
jgi:hypothetical protein